MLYLAGFIIFLHSVLPHQHHDQLSDAEHELVHESADGLIDYIALMLHVDLGDGHLEHFDSDTGNELDISATASSTPTLGLLADHIYLMVEKPGFISAELVFRDDPFLEAPFLKSYPLRGPPSIS